MSGSLLFSKPPFSQMHCEDRGAVHSKEITQSLLLIGLMRVGLEPSNLYQLKYNFFRTFWTAWLIILQRTLEGSKTIWNSWFECLYATLTFSLWSLMKERHERKDSPSLPSISCHECKWMTVAETYTTGSVLRSLYIQLHVCQGDSLSMYTYSAYSFCDLMSWHQGHVLTAQHVYVWMLLPQGTRV